MLDGMPTEEPAAGRAEERPALVRRTDGRLLAGVAVGIATHLDVSVTLVRILFALFLANGIGPLAYLALWLLLPAVPEGSLRVRHPRDVLRALLRNRPGDLPHRRRTLVLYAVGGSLVASVFGAFGLGFGGRSGLPLSVALVGALLIWWRAPQAQRTRWTLDARRYGTRLRHGGPLLVVLGGVGLVVAGVTAFLAAHDALAQARSGALAIGATLVGVLLVTGPWLFRLVRELTEERRQRIREHERAELAAHVHDSVLQTLALIQSRAADPAAVRRLARRQERELRGWLYDSKPDTSDGADAGPGERTFGGALREAAADVEDGHGINVDVVLVGDAALDGPLTATVAAAREAMVNAAKSSGAPSVSVFAEASTEGVEVFVRDRGRGFDPDTVPSDRRGIRDSIVGRMARHGGTAVIRSSTTGTEVVLSMSRQVRA